MFLVRLIQKNSQTLVFQLTALFSGLFIVFLLVAMGIAYVSIESILKHRMDKELIEDIEEFSELLSEEGEGALKDELEQEIEEEDPKDLIFQIIHVDGTVEYSTPKKHWPSLNQSLVHRTPKNIILLSEPYLDTFEHASRTYSARLVAGALKKDRVILIGESLEPIEKMMSLLLTIFSSLILILIPVAALLGWFMTRRAVKGIQSVSEAVVDLQQGQFDRRVTLPTSPIEVKQLAQAFNDMAEKIKRVIYEMREMIDNIAHDLKSPITRIRAISETALTHPSSQEQTIKDDYPAPHDSRQDSVSASETSATQTLVECDRLIHMINMTLDVAEVESGIYKKSFNIINITDLAEGIYDLFDALAEQKKIHLSFSNGESCQAKGDPQALQRVMSNLLDNAIKYTPEGGMVHLSVEKINSQWIQLTVRDTGLGIPEKEQSRIFERFYRCDQSRSEEGCGLGLSFVKAMIKAHQGTVEVFSEKGKGSIFTLQLPAA